MPIVAKVIRIRNGNGYNALDIARQLGNRELILHLTHHLGFAEQNTLKAIKQGKLDPRYADKYWLYRQKKYWPPEYYDWHSPYRPNNYWSRSMESLSTLDFEEDALRLADRTRLPPKEIRKLERENSLVKTIKNRDKALSNKEEIDKVLMGVDHLGRMESLSLRRKLEEERLSRAMSMYDLPHRKYYDPYLPIRDDESVSSSVLDYPPYPRNVKQIHKQRLYADALKSGDDRYLDKLLLSDHMFYDEPYGDQYEKEIMYWFKNRNAKKDKISPKMNAAAQSSSATNGPSSGQPAGGSTHPRRMSRAVGDEQAAHDAKHHQSFKLPPIPQQRSEDYETWLQKQQEDAHKKS